MAPLKAYDAPAANKFSNFLENMAYIYNPDFSPAKSDYKRFVTFVTAEADYQHNIVENTLGQSNSALGTIGLFASKSNPLDEAKNADADADADNDNAPSTSHP